MYADNYGFDAPCTYLKRQIQDSRGRKPVSICVSSDGQFIGVLYVPRSTTSILKTLDHLDRSLSKVLKTKLLHTFHHNPFTRDASSVGERGNKHAYSTYKSYLDFITDGDKFDIYEEIEGLGGVDSVLWPEHPASPVSFNIKALAQQRNIKQEDDTKTSGGQKNVRHAGVVIYDTFFMNPIVEFLLHELTSTHTSNTLHTIHFKFSLGDRFLLCLINGFLWALDHVRTCAAALVDLSSISNPPIQSLDLISFTPGTHSAANSSGEAKKSNCAHLSEFEMLVHREDTYPVKAKFYAETETGKGTIHLVKDYKVEELKHLLAVGGPQPLKCRSSALLVPPAHHCHAKSHPCSYRCYDMQGANELLGHLVAMKDGSPVQLRGNAPTNAPINAPINASIVAVLEGGGASKLVLLDLSCWALTEVLLPIASYPLKIKLSHNARHVCCLGPSSLVAFELSPPFVLPSVLENGDCAGKSTERVCRVRVVLKERESTGEFVDAAFGGRWLYVSMHRGVSSSILAIYDLDELLAPSSPRDAISCAAGGSVFCSSRDRVSSRLSAGRRHIELSLNSTMLPMLRQLAAVPYGSSLLCLPSHRRYVAALAPEYSENWGDTSTRIFLRFPPLSSNLQLLQLAHSWDSGFSFPPASAKTESFRVDSHSETAVKAGCGCRSGLIPYSIWPYIEAALAGGARQPDLPPLRRTRYFGHEQVRCSRETLSFVTPCGSSCDGSLSKGPMGFSHYAALELMDQILKRYCITERGGITEKGGMKEKGGIIKGSIIKGSIKWQMEKWWEESLLELSSHFLASLKLTLDLMGTGTQNLCPSPLENYVQRLERLRELWLKRMEERGIVLKKKTACSAPFQSLTHPLTLEMLQGLACTHVNY